MKILAFSDLHCDLDGAATPGRAQRRGRRRHRRRRLRLRPRGPRGDDRGAGAIEAPTVLVPGNNETEDALREAAPRLAGGDRAARRGRGDRRRRLLRARRRRAGHPVGLELRPLRAEAERDARGRARGRGPGRPLPAARPRGPLGRGDHLGSAAILAAIEAQGRSSPSAATSTRAGASAPRSARPGSRTSGPTGAVRGLARPWLRLTGLGREEGLGGCGERPGGWREICSRYAAIRRHCWRDRPEPGLSSPTQLGRSTTTIAPGKPKAPPVGPWRATQGTPHIGDAFVHANHPTCRGAATSGPEPRTRVREITVSRRGSRDRGRAREPGGHGAQQAIGTGRALSTWRFSASRSPIACGPRHPAWRRRARGLKRAELAKPARGPAGRAAAPALPGPARARGPHLVHGSARDVDPLAGTEVALAAVEANAQRSLEDLEVLVRWGWRCFGGASPPGRYSASTSSASAPSRRMVTSRGVSFSLSVISVPG